MPDTQPIRIPVVEPLETRDATTSFDSKMVNCVMEKTVRGTIMARKRPGLSLAFQGTVGTGQGITNYSNTLYSVSGDVLNQFLTGAALVAQQSTASAAWSKRIGSFAVGFNGKLWVMGGWRFDGVPLNDVWSSTDGVNWIQVSATSPWAARGKGQAIVFNGAIYIMGGAASATGTHYSDVWHTTDGITWVQDTAFAWPGRRRFGATVFNNLLWVAGGQGADITNPNNNWPHTMYSDVYSSVDGVHWTKTASQAPWIARSDFSFFGINGKLRVVGGQLTDPFANATSDLWSSPDGITWTRDSANPFGVAASGVWPIGAFNSYGNDFTIPSPVTVSGGNGSSAAAWAFTDFDDDGDDDDLSPGPYSQLTFSNVGSGYTIPPTLALGTNVGFNANAYAMLNGAANGGAKLVFPAQLGNVIYLLEFSASGTYNHVIWTTTDGVTYTNAGATFPTGWVPREGEFFGFGNLWFLDGEDAALNFYNDVWFLSPGASTFPLNPNVPNLFYHFNQTSVSITQPLLVFKSTKDLFEYNSSLNILTKLTTSANYPATTVPGLVYLDGYFFVMDPQGRIWNSGINDPTTWNSLGFIAMQNEPNGGVAIAKLFNYVVGLGQWTTEFFYDNANPAPASPLAPNTTFPFQVGCAAGESVIEMQNSIVFIGQTKREGQGVYMFINNEPQRISTPFIDRILQNDPLTAISAINVDAAGYSLYILTLRTSNITICYSFNSQMWSVWTSTSAKGTVAIQSLTSDPYGLVTANSTSHGLSDGDPALITGASTTGYNGSVNVQVIDTNTFQYLVSPVPGPNFGTAVLTGYSEALFSPVASAQVLDIDYLQDPSNGVIYAQLLSNYTDSNQPINARIITDRFDGGNSQWKTLRRFSLIGDFEASNCMIAYTDNDYQTYTSYRTVSLQQGQRATFVQGGRFRRRAFIIRHTANTPFRAEFIELEIITGGF